MAADTTKKHFIRIRGANVNNLKNLSVDIPRDKFVVFTGLSGSGKSSLAFDTIYAEGQRRYMESLSSYARQFLGQMEKPSFGAPIGNTISFACARIASSSYGKSPSPVSHTSFARLKTAHAFGQPA